MKSDAVKFIRKKIIRILSNRRFWPVGQSGDVHSYAELMISDRLQSVF